MNLLMKKVAAMAAMIIAISVMSVPVMAADNNVTINVNGDNNTVSVVISSDGTVEQDVPTLASIPSDARAMNIWAGGECRATGYIVGESEEIYVASMSDIKKIFPVETRNWKDSVSVAQATPLYMWADSFGYTYKVEANNVFLLQNGLKDNSGELIVAKPLTVLLDGKRVANITVYLSDEDETVYAGLEELKKIFADFASKISCTEVSQYTINYWAEQLGYEFSVDPATAEVKIKKVQPTATPTTPAVTTPTETPATSTPAATSTPPSESTTPAITPAPNYVAKSFKLVAENKITTVTPKSKLVNNVEKIYVTKAQANKILKKYGKKSVSKALEIKSLAKKCGVSCKIKGDYIYFNKKLNSAVMIKLEGKVMELSSGLIQSKKSGYFVSSDVIKKLIGAKVTWNKKTGNITVVRNNKVLQFKKGQKFYYNTKGGKCVMKTAPYVSGKKIMLPVTTIARGLGYNTYLETEPGISTISITSKK